MLPIFLLLDYEQGAETVSQNEQRDSVEDKSFEFLVAEISLVGFMGLWELPSFSSKYSSDRSTSSLALAKYNTITVNIPEVQSQSLHQLAHVSSFTSQMRDSDYRGAGKFDREHSELPEDWCGSLWLSTPPTYTEAAWWSANDNKFVVSRRRSEGCAGWSLLILTYGLGGQPYLGSDSSYIMSLTLV